MTPTERLVLIRLADALLLLRSLGRLPELDLAPLADARRAMDAAHAAHAALCELRPQAAVVWHSPEAAARGECRCVVCVTDPTEAW